MSYVLTIVMCAYIEGRTSCMPPFRFEQQYVDAYKNFDKAVNNKIDAFYSSLKWSLQDYFPF